jgi:hypothetical protein
MTKGDWLTADMLLIPSSVGLIKDQKGGIEFATFPNQ